MSKPGEVSCIFLGNLVIVAAIGTKKHNPKRNSSFSTKPKEKGVDWAGGGNEIFQKKRERKGGNILSISSNGKLSWSNFLLLI